MTDSAGNTYTKLTSLKASDNTELSVWSAPITAGARHQAHHHGHDHRQRRHRRHRPRVLRPVDGRRASASSTCPRRRPARRRRRPPSPRARPRPAPAPASSPSASTPTRASATPWPATPATGAHQRVADQRHGAAGPGPRPVRPPGATAEPHDRARARTRRGWPPPSSSRPRRPRRRAAPNTPNGVTASPGNGRRPSAGPRRPTAAARSRSTPSRPTSASTAQTPTVVTGNPPATTATVTGLVNNTTYTFTVTATNANGTGRPRSPPTRSRRRARRGGQWSALMNWPMVAVHSVLLKNGNLLIWDGWQDPQPTVGVERDHRRPFPRRSTPRAASSAPATPPARRAHPHRRRLRHPHHRQPRPRRHRHLRPRDGDVEARRRHEPAALVPVAHRARRRPLRGHQRQLDQPDDVGRHARGLRPGDQHVDAADRRLDAPGPRGGVPVQLPRARTARSSPSGPQEDDSFFLDVDRQDVDAGRRRQRRASTARRSCTARARSSTAAARRASQSSTTAKANAAVIDLTAAHAGVAQTVPSMAQRPHLPHADHAGRRAPCSRSAARTRATSRSSRAAC